MATDPKQVGLTNCPTCNTTVYQYNIHVCGECGAQTCYYCEAAHNDNHTKEDNAKVQK